WPPRDDSRSRGGRPLGGRRGAVRRVPLQGARGGAARRDRTGGADQVVLVPLGRRGERERDQDGSLDDGAPQGGDPHAQLPRRDPRDAVPLPLSTPISFRAAPPRRG